MTSIEIYIDGAVDVKVSQRYELDRVGTSSGKRLYKLTPSTMIIEVVSLEEDCE